MAVCTGSALATKARARAVRFPPTRRSPTEVSVLSQVCCPEGRVPRRKRRAGERRLQEACDSRARGPPFSAERPPSRAHVSYSLKPREVTSLEVRFSAEAPAQLRAAHARLARLRIPRSGLQGGAHVAAWRRAAAASTTFQKRRGPPRRPPLGARGEAAPAAAGPRFPSPRPTATAVCAHSRVVVSQANFKIYGRRRVAWREEPGPLRRGGARTAQGGDVVLQAAWFVAARRVEFGQDDD